MESSTKPVKVKNCPVTFPYSYVFSAVFDGISSRADTTVSDNTILEQVLIIARQLTSKLQILTADD
jgi:hypothetical protein